VSKERRKRKKSLGRNFIALIKWNVIIMISELQKELPFWSARKRRIIMI
jgi:hypothetical protein